MCDRNDAINCRIFEDDARTLYLVVEDDCEPVYVGEFRDDDDDVKNLAECIADADCCNYWDFNLLDENPSIVEELESDNGCSEIESVYRLETQDWSSYYGFLDDAEWYFWIMCRSNTTDKPVRIVDAITGRIIKEQDLNETD